MAKRITIGNADFSNNAIMISHRLLSSMLEQGLVDAIPGTGIRPPSGGNDYMNRTSLITNTALSDYSKVTVPAGMQWCATYFDEDGVSVGANASWVKNQTGSTQTYEISSASNYVDTAYYFHMSFGYIDGSQLDKEDFDTTVKIYLDKPDPVPPQPTELRLTSSMVEVGMLDVATGNIDTTPPRDKRVSYRQQTFLSDFSRVSIPAGIKWAVLWRDDENQTVNPSSRLTTWTTTPGDSGGGIVNISDAASQLLSECTGATSYYITFGKIDSSIGGTDYLSPSELDTTIEIKLLPPSNE